MLKVNKNTLEKGVKIFPMETMFLYTHTICTERAQFLRLKIVSILCQSNRLLQSVHIIMLTLLTAARVLLANRKTVKTNKTVNLYLKKFFINCTFGSSQCKVSLKKVILKSKQNL